VADWRNRIDECFETFVSAAAETGFDRETIRAHFRPEDALWTPVRLRDRFGTVEWRGPDATIPSAVLRLVGDIRRVLQRAVDRGTEITEQPAGTGDVVSVPPFETLRGTVDAAIAHGIDAPGLSS
jgi:hypothetical protein